MKHVREIISVCKNTMQQSWRSSILDPIKIHYGICANGLVTGRMKQTHNDGFYRLGIWFKSLTLHYYSLGETSTMVKTMPSTMVSQTMVNHVVPSWANITGLHLVRCLQIFGTPITPVLHYFKWACKLLWLLHSNSMHVLHHTWPIHISTASERAT